MLLSKLIQITSSEVVNHSVICLTSAQKSNLSISIERIGVDIIYLDMQNNKLGLFSIFKLINLLNKSCCDVIHTWMYHANLIGGFANKLSINVPLIWSIHHLSDEKHDLDNKMTRAISAICSYLSCILPKQIVYCSKIAKENHEKSGYCKNKSIVIDNGIDIDIFKPNQFFRSSLRSELSLDGNSFIIGLVARYHYLKGHSNFIKAASILLDRKYDVKFLLCGEGCNINNAHLKHMLLDSSILDHFYLLGERDDIPRITAALDVATSTSISESFSLTVGEAMSSGILCAVTKSGGADYLLGSNGWTVSVGDSQSLADAWEEIINIDFSKRLELQKESRNRIVDKFSLKAMTNKYLSLYEKLIINCSGL
jgi:glycosyltransferase involved in cell wall biosynthesis